MDPENLRTVVTGLVTVTAALVPSILLYRQNRVSGDRETAERRELRTAEDERHRAERKALEAERRDANREAIRQRFVRFTQVVERIFIDVRHRDAYHEPHGIPESDRHELAMAYEDVMLTPSDRVRREAKAVRAALNDALSQVTSYRGPATEDQVAELERRVTAFRDACLNALDLDDL